MIEVLTGTVMTLMDRVETRIIERSLLGRPAGLLDAEPVQSQELCLSRTIRLFMGRLYRSTHYSFHVDWTSVES